MKKSQNSIIIPLEKSQKDIIEGYKIDISKYAKDSANEIMEGNLGIYKGAIYENIIADIFTKNGKKLYYFEYNSTLEIDFFIRYENVATAIEVKSADNTKSKSLNSIITNWGVAKGIRLSSKNNGTSTDKIKYIPIYMAMFL